MKEQKDNNLRYSEKYSENRPWGYFEKFCENNPVTVKILYIKPNERISLQYHNKREEFWKIIKGEADIIIGKNTIYGKENDEFYISKGIEHRIIARDKGVSVLEISFGYFDEHDEVRIEDKYKRI